MLPVKSVHRTKNICKVSSIFNNLDGVINIFKPSGVKYKKVKDAVLHNICKDLNNIYLQETLQSHPELLCSDGVTTSSLEKLNTLRQHEVLSTKGQIYEMDDFRWNVVSQPGRHTSGVLILGIGNGVKYCKKMQRNRQLRVYHVTGELGTATADHFPHSRIIAKANYRHIGPERFSYLASSVQASHLRKYYELCGIDPQSQTAYEIASKGLLHKIDNTQPMIYSVKLIDFQSPHFTLEIHSINETEDYLAALVHDMAIELRSVAHCTNLRCIRHGRFTLENALLRHNWNLKGVMNNIQLHKNITIA